MDLYYIYIIFNKSNQNLNGFATFYAWLIDKNTVQNRN